MNAVKIIENANYSLEHGTITLGEYDEIVKPLEDVEPVIHAHWEPFEKEGYWIQDIEEIWETGKPTKQTQYRCSHCLTEFGIIVVEQNYLYCPKCNAKMDEEVENECIK